MTARTGYPEIDNGQRRIMAALVACKGLSTEALEAGAIAELVEVAQAVLKRIDEGLTLGGRLEIEPLRAALAKLEVKP